MVRLTVTGGPPVAATFLSALHSIEEADPLAVGREEEAARRAHTLERRGLKLIEGAHEDLLGTGADVREARAVRRDRDRAPMLEGGRAGRGHRQRTTCGGAGRVSVQTTSRRQPRRSDDGRDERRRALPDAKRTERRQQRRDRVSQRAPSAPH